MVLQYQGVHNFDAKSSEGGAILPLIKHWIDAEEQYFGTRDILFCHNCFKRIQDNLFVEEIPDKCFHTNCHPKKTPNRQMYSTRRLNEVHDYHLEGEKASNLHMKSMMEYLVSEFQDFSYKIIVSHNEDVTLENLQTQLVFVPILSLDKHHWTLAILESHEQILYYYDSLSIVEPTIPTRLEMLPYEIKNISQYPSFEQLNLPIQKDNTSCGWCVIRAAMLIAAERKQRKDIIIPEIQHFMKYWERMLSTEAFWTEV